VTLNWRHKAGLFLALTAAGLALLLDLSAKQAAGIALLIIAFAWLIGNLTLRTFGLTSLVLISLLGFYVATAPVWGDWRSFRESANEYDFAIIELHSVVAKAKPGIDISAGFVGMEESKGNGFSLWIPVKSNQIDWEQYAEPASSAAGHSPAKQKKGIRGKTVPIPKGAQIDTTSAWTPVPEVRSVELPEAAEKWVRAEQQAFQDWFAQHALATTDLILVTFPGNMSDTDIMRAFETKILRPRPTFSLATALGAHLWSLLVGLALFASGLFGCAWMLQQGRKTSQDSAS
jgi:hypothetical protein